MRRLSSWIIASAFIPLLIAAAAATTATEERVAKIFPLGSPEGTPLFVQTSHLAPTADGGTEKSTTIVDKSGATALTEVARYQGDRLVSQRVEQFQAKEIYEVSVAGGKIKFRTYAMQDGKTGPLKSEKTEDLTQDFVTGPTLEPYLKEHWPEILKGDTVRTRFGVMERDETVGFKFWKTGETQLNGKRFIDVRMRPSSFFIAALVAPIDLQIDNADLRLVHYHGRTPLLHLEGGKWKPLDANITYAYPP